MSLAWVLGVGKTVIGVLALVYIAVAGLIYFVQSRLVFVPAREMVGNPSIVGLAFEDIQLRSTNDNVIQAWFVPASQNRGTVLFCHGNAGNISHRMDTLLILNRLGMNVMIFDYQGYGLSQGKPGEKETGDDARAAWSWLVEQRGENPSRIIVMGRSLGGGVAAALASETHPAGLVLESTFTSVPDMGARMFPFLPVRILSRIRYDSLSLIKSMKCPLLVAHSEEDDVVPHVMGRTLFEAAPEPKSFMGLEGDHNNGFRLTGDRYEQGLDLFFEQVLNHGG